MKNATEAMNISRILEMMASVCIWMFAVCVSIGMSIYREKLQRHPSHYLLVFISIPIVIPKVVVVYV